MEKSNKLTISKKIQWVNVKGSLVFSFSLHLLNVVGFEDND